MQITNQEEGKRKEVIDAKKFKKELHKSKRVVDIVEMPEPESTIPSDQVTTCSGSINLDLPSYDFYFFLIVRGLNFAISICLNR